MPERAKWNPHSLFHDPEEAPNQAREKPPKPKKRPKKPQPPAEPPHYFNSKTYGREADPQALLIARMVSAFLGKKPTEILLKDGATLQKMRVTEVDAKRRTLSIRSSETIEGPTLTIPWEDIQNIDV